MLLDDHADVFGKDFIDRTIMDVGSGLVVGAGACQPKPRAELGHRHLPAFGQQRIAHRDHHIPSGSGFPSTSCTFVTLSDDPGLIMVVPRRSPS